MDSRKERATQQMARAFPPHLAAYGPFWLMKALAPQSNAGWLVRAYVKMTIAASIVGRETT